MKMRLLLSLIAALGVIGANGLFAQGTAFIYEGQLKQHGQPAHGQQDLRFSLYTVPNNGTPLATQDKANVPVDKGSFNVTLDYGVVFDGNPRWLEISVKSRKGDFVALSPRQKFMPTPYAIMANSASNLLGTLPASKITGTLPASQISGTIPSTQITGPIPSTQIIGSIPSTQISGQIPSSQITGPIPISQVSGVLPSGQLSGLYSSALSFNNPSNMFVGNGAGLTSVDALTLKGLGPESFWKLTGNGGTNPTNNFLGTTDKVALELRVNSTRAVRVEPGTNGAPNIIAGAAGNIVGQYIAPGYFNGKFIAPTGSIHGATIAGGGSSDPFETNGIASDFGTIGGGAANTIESRSQFTTIGGGYWNSVLTRSSPQSTRFSVISGGTSNVIGTALGTIGGGRGNSIFGSDDPGGIGDTIAGGMGNSISSQIVSGGGAIGGGMGNTLHASYGTIAGGNGNLITHAGSGPELFSATIGGGTGNQIIISNIFQPNERYVGYATIAGGYLNTALGTFSTIAGGCSNLTYGNFSMAAGMRAHAVHNGAFVWADLGTPVFRSTATNSFSVRATGGARFVSAIDTNGTPTAGVELPSGGGAWATLSDRDSKENLTPVNAREVLDRVSQMPISTRNYKSQDSAIRHIGPMAQDFAAAFNVGENDRRITTVDADGVALAAIQGLNQVVKEKDAEIKELKQRLEKLEQLINQNKGHAQ